MSKNVIIAIVVIVIIIAGIIWFMGQDNTATDVDYIDGGEVVEMGDNSGSFTTDSDDTAATDGTLDAGSDLEVGVSTE